MVPYKVKIGLISTLVRLSLEVLLGLSRRHGLLLFLLLHKVLDELVDVEEMLGVEDGDVAAHCTRVTCQKKINAKYEQS